MSVQAIEKVNIIACRKNRKAVLEMLQSRGMMEVSVCVPCDTFSLEDTSIQISQFDKQLELLTSAIDVLDRAVPEKTPFYMDAKIIQNRDIDDARYNANKIFEYAKDVLSLSNKIEECKSQISNNNVKILAQQSWRQLDCSLSFSGTAKTAVFIGSIPLDLDQTELQSQITGIADIPIYIELLSHSKERTCFFVMSHINDKDAVAKALSALEFVNAALETQNLLPNEIIQNLEMDNQGLQEEISDCQQKTIELSDQKLSMQILYDNFYARKEKYEIIRQLAHSHKTFILTGYVPAVQVDELSSTLERDYSAFLEKTELIEGQELPVKLKNNAFAKPVENIVESFSIPSKDDIDPTFIMSIFYYFYFGMMFSDAGYGLLVMIVCGLLGFAIKNVKPGLKNSMRMFFFCGVSTFIWGLLYGGFFGNAISVISNGFFNVNIEFAPILFDPVKDPLRLLILSVALGVIHILTGNILKFASLWRNGKRFDAVCDAGFWTLLLFGICTMAVWIGVGAAFLKIPSFVLMGVGVVGQVLMAGRDNKNIFMRLFIGILSLYDITGFLSDALSYSRLMALGLATGVIANVANTMSALFGFNIIGGILFWIVFIAFHLINFGINMLGAYVHTNRLQYVEFFGKFYEGGGRKFKPFSKKYKYTRVEERV